ncbi:HAD domain-containing protein [Streptomyces violaceusniger]|uniref:Secreted protein n=1 Tax=Streptomyces violaceusniger (strain Tu 4113) TaxID=653045 RepID=G2PHL6_STRV4|nr:HAD domain-containing protein [Streptomyces violaceusniger]AEM89019.1 hypothetical protein Strvi_0246 [Streptomyces violaceusniger Tu 4113]
MTTTAAATADLPTSPEKPLLLLDVDGPLNPYAAPAHRRPEGYTTHRMRPPGWEDRWQKPLRVWLKPDHGPALLALPYRLVWCSTWQTHANTFIAPVLGLPELEHVPFPSSPSRPNARLYWKTSYVVDWAAGRPFVWVDDETTKYDQEYVDDHHEGFGRIVHVKPNFGLRDDDFALINAWARDAVATSEGEPR